MTEYISDIKTITSPRSSVYSRLSSFRDKNPFIEMLREQNMANAEIEILDEDRCAFAVPMAGKLVLRIVEREPEKMIKLEAEHSPLPITLWVQLVEKELGQTHLRLTLHTELNVALKMMIGNKLQDAVNRLATLLATIAQA